MKNPASTDLNGADSGRPGQRRRAAVAPGVPPGDLAARANLGPKSARVLADAGITSFEQLKAMGSVAAFAKVEQSGAAVSLNLLWALEGALSGIHWQVVAREHRTSLLLALEAYRNGV